MVGFGDIPGVEVFLRDIFVSGEGNQLVGDVEQFIFSDVELGDLVPSQVIQGDADQFGVVQVLGSLMWEDESEFNSLERLAIDRESRVSEADKPLGNSQVTRCT